MTTPPRDEWLGATRVLNRPVPVAEPYPHICGAAIPPKYVHRLTRRNCGACGDELHHQLVRAPRYPPTRTAQTATAAAAAHSQPSTPCMYCQNSPTNNAPTRHAERGTTSE